MLKFKQLFALISILFLISCGTVKKAFENEKKTSTDEFLVKKKSPLVMPPNYGELPIPKEDKDIANNSENEFKTLISKENKDEELNKEETTNKNIEETLLDKIKSN